MSETINDKGSEQKTFQLKPKELKEVRQLVDKVGRIKIGHTNAELHFYEKLYEMERDVWDLVKKYGSVENDKRVRINWDTGVVEIL